MGSIGSQQISGLKRGTVDACRSIDVNHLHKGGFLRPGSAGALYWVREGKTQFEVDLHAGSDWISLSYRVPGGDLVRNVAIVRSPCPFGGTRPYWVCPGMHDSAPCSRRVMKLCMVGRHFLCRHCHRLAYASQREGQRDRALRRARKLRYRLGGDASLAKGLPPRPKGMWRRTYDRLCKQAIAADALAFQILERRFAHIRSSKRLNAGQLSGAGGQP